MEEPEEEKTEYEVPLKEPELQTLLSRLKKLQEDKLDGTESMFFENVVTNLEKVLAGEGARFIIVAMNAHHLAERFKPKEFKELKELVCGAYIKQDLEKAKSDPYSFFTMTACGISSAEHHAEMFGIELPEEYHRLIKVIGDCFDLIANRETEKVTGSTDTYKIASALNWVGMICNLNKRPLPAKHGEIRKGLEKLVEESVNHDIQEAKSLIKMPVTRFRKLNINTLDMAKSYLSAAENYAKHFGVDLPASFNEATSQLEAKVGKLDTDDFDTSVERIDYSSINSLLGNMHQQGYGMENRGLAIVADTLSESFEKEAHNVAARYPELQRYIAKELRIIKDALKFDDCVIAAKALYSIDSGCLEFPAGFTTPVYVRAIEQLLSKIETNDIVVLREISDLADKYASKIPKLPERVSRYREDVLDRIKFSQSIDKKSL
jgi:hypothetical protein